jgi:hypothetical protein
MSFNENYYGRFNGSRKKHKFNPDSIDDQEIAKAALLFRQRLYDYAQSLFNKSPNLLKQLSPKEVGAKGDGLVLFSTDTHLRIKNAKSIVLNYLLNRADIHVHKEEKENLKLLINFVNSFTIEKEDI